VQFGLVTKEASMHAFESIDLLALVTVTGGGDGDNSGIFGPGAGANRDRIAGDLKAKLPALGIEASGAGSYETARDAYGKCLDKLPSNPTDKQLEICSGLAGK
jgi:hypothetical protein